MGEDASLDDFLAGESSEQSEAADTQEAAADVASADEAGAAEPKDAGEAETAVAETESEPAAETDDRESTDTVAPATTTYAWSDEGTVCEGCGETVERRWQQDGGLVCIECKDWERA